MLKSDKTLMQVSDNRQEFQLFIEHTQLKKILKAQNTLNQY